MRSACKFRIEAGMRVRVRGRLGVYDRDGKMQLYADFAEPAGLGAEALALEQLKQKLAAEGMFAPGKKRPLPRFPKRIGVVTSRDRRRGSRHHPHDPAPVPDADPDRRCSGARPDGAAPDRDGHGDGRARRRRRR